MNKIEVLIGMIASGKSTYCRKRAKEGAIIVNDDALVTLLHGGDYTLYTQDLKKLYKSIDINIVTMALSIGLDVVIDKTNLTKSTRQRYISLGECLEVPIVGIIFKKELAEVHAKRRFESDSRGHIYEKWLKVAKEHERLWQEPDISEGFSQLLEERFSIK
jgi:predicted kinase